MQDEQSNRLTFDEEGIEQLIVSMQASLQGEGETASLQATFGLQLAVGLSQQQAQGVTSLPLLALSEEGDGGDALPELERLQLLSPLGKGGIGEVHLAHQSSLSRHVAVKRLRPEHSSDIKMMTMLREAKITGFLEHPNIIPVHLLGRDEAGQPVFVMKRVEGVSWRTLIHDPTHRMWSQMQLAESEQLQRHVEILIEVCKALEFAHSKGFLHCDVKPENVMIGRFGEVYLLDWGIAMPIPSVAQPSGGEVPEVAKQLIGTPAYMAPEMLFGPSLFAPYTDVYLLGATLHEVLTKRVKHEGSDIKAVLYAALQSLPEPYDDDIPVELAAICHHATHAAPEDRCQTPRDFRMSLQSFLRHRAATALGREAEERLRELSALISEEGSTEEQTARDTQIQRLFTECRFGFLQALREWEDNAAAKAGLDVCISEMLGYLVRRENLGAAEALFSELESPSAGLEREFEALQHKYKQQQAIYEEHIADSDRSISSRTRFFIVALMCMISVATPLLFFPTVFGRGDETRLSVVLNSLSLWISGVFCSLVLRKQLLTNQLNRRFLRFVMVLLSILLIHRLLGWLHHVDTAHTLTVDFFVMGALALYASDEGWAYLLIACVEFSMGLWAFFRPEQLFLIYNVMFVFVGVIYIIWSRQGKRSALNH